MAYLEVSDVTKVYERGRGQSVQALSGVSLQLDRGEFVSIVGPSGCGKTTLFDIVAGLTRPDQGRVLIDGIDRTGSTGYASYMPQEDLLLPWRTTLQNVMLAPELRGGDIAESKKEVMQLMGMFGLSGFENSYPFELSGGMRQRVALMRTVMCKNDIMLLDEPFGALDAITRREMQSWLRSVWEQLRITVLFVTHDVEEAVYLSDRVYVMSGRPGRIVHEHEVALGPKRPSSIIQLSEFIALRSQVMDSLDSIT